jgi:hypothetical protein
MGQRAVSACLLHELEGFPTYVLEPPTPFADAGHWSPVQKVAALFADARRSAPSVVFLPDVERWASGGDSPVHEELLRCLVDALTALPPRLPILILSTANCPYGDLPPPLTGCLTTTTGCFSWNADATETVAANGLCELPPPSSSAIASFFEGAVLTHSLARHLSESVACVRVQCAKPSSARDSPIWRS